MAAPGKKDASTKRGPTVAHALNDETGENMRLTRQSEVAVALLVCCARSREGHVRTDDAAQSAGTTKEHAAQIVRSLVHAGFLESVRGRNGGIRLTRNSHDIRLGGVLGHMQPDLAYHISAVTPDDATMLGALVAAAEVGFLSFMDRYSVADLVGDHEPDHPHCRDDERCLS